MLKKLKLLFSLWLFVCQQVQAAPEVYRRVEVANGIPESLLYAMALTESGLTITDSQYVPWPWTLNVGGQARYFRTRKKAWIYLQAAKKSGQKNIDIGPVQVNWKWNGHRFSNTWSSLDPLNNIEVAAQILVECKQRKGDWVKAVGCYHSPSNQDRAMAYTSRVYKQWEKL